MSTTPNIYDPQLIFYGPHPCERCERTIVKVAREQGGHEFDAPIVAYPNSHWIGHVCRKGTDLDQILSPSKEADAADLATCVPASPPSVEPPEKQRCPRCEYDQPSRHMIHGGLRCPNCGHRWDAQKVDVSRRADVTLGEPLCKNCGRPAERHQGERCPRRVGYHPSERYEPVAEPAATPRSSAEATSETLNCAAILREFGYGEATARMEQAVATLCARLASTTASLDAMRVERDGLKEAINRFAETFDAWMALPDDDTLLPEYVAMSAARERLLLLRSPEAGT